MIRTNMIRNQQMVDGQEDWSDIFTGLPRGIAPSDIDGIIEVGGRFLVLEEKGVGAGCSRGQYRMLCELAKRGFTVVVFRPVPDAADGVEIMLPPKADWERTTRAAFRQRIVDWVA